MNKLRIKLEILGAMALIAFIIWSVFGSRSFIGDSDAVDRCVAQARNLFSSNSISDRAEMHNACRDVFENEEFRERYDKVATEIAPDSRIREYARAAQDIYCPQLDSPPAQCSIDLDGASHSDAEAAWFALRDAIYKMEIGDELSDRLLDGIENARQHNPNSSIQR